MADTSRRDRITDAIMRFFLPNTYGPPAQGAPNPFTPPLWRDQRNLDDPLFYPQPQRPPGAGAASDADQQMLQQSLPRY